MRMRNRRETTCFQPGLRIDESEAANGRSGDTNRLLSLSGAQPWL